MSMRAVSQNNNTINENSRPHSNIRGQESQFNEMTFDAENIEQLKEQLHRQIAELPQSRTITPKDYCKTVNTSQGHSIMHRRQT